MLTFLLLTCLCVSVSESEDLGYSLNIGNAIDVFANYSFLTWDLQPNGSITVAFTKSIPKSYTFSFTEKTQCYGDLSQVTQVVSADYEDEDETDPEPFREKNIRVFLNVSSREFPGDAMVDINILLFENFDELLDGYFQNFHIEGTDKPWKAFMGDWITDEIMRTLGIEYDPRSDSCCYVLVKLTRVHQTVKVEDLSNVLVTPYVKRAIDTLNASDVTDVRRFMKSYGTHYIDSYSTGNFIYQVFKFKRSGFNLLRTYIRARNKRQVVNSDTVRFYFSSYFLKQVGDIRIASGNKDVEDWARRNLRDSQYLYSRPSLLRLHYNPIMAYKLNDMLNNGALLALGLKTLKPLFADEEKRLKFIEVVENDMKLWEVNA